VDRAACRDYRLRQEFITPYTPEQNGMTSFAEARREITRWMRRYNAERPHSALGYESPVDYRAQQVASVA